MRLCQKNLSWTRTCGTRRRRQGCVFFVLWKHAKPLCLDIGHSGSILRGPVPRVSYAWAEIARAWVHHRRKTWHLSTLCNDARRNDKQQLCCPIHKLQVNPCGAILGAKQIVSRPLEHKTSEYSAHVYEKSSLPPFERQFAPLSRGLFI